MSKIGILLPGRIGDIVICLPIAKHLHDSGHEVYWGVWDNMLSNFDKGNIDYVNFFGVPFDSNCNARIIDKFNSIGCEVIDLSFNNIGSWDNENTKAFRESNLPFDEFRYNIANLTIDKKWPLHINRNELRENKLYDIVVKQDDYAVVHLQGSTGRKNINLDNRNNLQIIEIQPMTDCIFDWVKVIEGAEYIICFDSCFANLVNQLEIDTKKIFLTRSRSRETPALSSDWKILK